MLFQADPDSITPQKPYEASHANQTPLYEYVYMFPKAVRNKLPIIKYRRVTEQVARMHKIMPVLLSGPGLAMTEVMGEKVRHGVKSRGTACSTAPGVSARSSLRFE